ncbi:MAG: hypothetical protein WCK74_10490 [Gemmatimonadaceae bacterium]
MQVYQDIKQGIADGIAEGAQSKTGTTQPPAGTKGAANSRVEKLPRAIVIKGTDGGQDVTINVDAKGIHLLQGTEETVIPIKDVVPQRAVDILGIVMGSLVLTVVGLPLALAWARRIARRPLPTAMSSELAARLESLERNIDTVAVEVERVSEAQRFTTRLLEQRTPEHAQRPDR